MPDTTSRTLELLSLLQGHRHWSARELAERLAVSDRTLRRDIERLRGLGYGVEATRGSIGGYRLEAGTGLPPLLLSDDEGVAIAVGLRSQAAAGLKGAEHTTISALAKVEQVLPPALRRRIAALQSHTAVAPDRAGGPGAPEVDAEVLGLLALCCRDGERLRFRYTDAGGAVSARSVEPYRLVPLARRWYLLAWDRERDDWRTFRLDRMSEPFPTRVRFEPRSLSDEEARLRVEKAVRWRDPSVRARVIAEMPFAEFTRHFGRWAHDAAPLDEARTSWEIEADSVENLFMGLMWMPAGVRYHVEGSPEVTGFLRVQAARLARAVV